MPETAQQQEKLRNQPVRRSIWVAGYHHNDYHGRRVLWGRWGLHGVLCDLPKAAASFRSLWLLTVSSS